jgi:hypothetical protein
MRSPRESGRAAAIDLHEKLAAAGLLDGLAVRLQQAMATSAPVARPESGEVSPAFAGLSDHVLCFAAASLAYVASERFTRRLFGAVRISIDEAGWQQFTEGVLEYATESMPHPATRSEIVQDIHDQVSAAIRFSASYPPEASGVLMEAADQIRRVARDVVRRIDA